MQRFGEGDRVRIDIPDRDDPDHEQFHREHGTVVDTFVDAAGEETKDERDSVLFRVELDEGEVMDFRWRDLRPAHDE